MEAERLEEAETHLRRRLALGLTSQDDRLLWARVARLRGDFDVAAQRLEQVRSADGDSDALQLEWTLLRAQRQWGELDEVAPRLWLCVEQKHPESPAILETLTRAYMHEVRLPSALVCLDRWTELVPNCARAWDWRGWVHERLRKPSTAQRDYTRAVELDATRDEARLRLARLLLEGREREQAWPHIEYLLQKQPERVEVQTLLAQCRALEGKAEEARDILRASLAGAPDDADVLRHVGKLEVACGALDEAEKVFRRALEIDPYLSEARYSLAQCLRRQGRNEEADRELALWKEKNEGVARLNDLLARQGPRSPAREAREIGELFRAMKQPRLSRRWLEIAVERDPYLKSARRAGSR